MLQVALLKSAVDTWEFIEVETERRQKAAEEAEAQRKAEKMLPRSKRKRSIKPWISGGSEVRHSSIQIWIAYLLRSHTGTGVSMLLCMYVTACTLFAQICNMHVCRCRLLHVWASVILAKPRAFATTEGLTLRAVLCMR
jgi:hypothetical protein